VKDDFQCTDLFISRQLWERIRKPVISAFLALHLTVFIIYVSLPNQTFSKFIEPVQKYFVFLALFQGYGVFAPSPRVANLHVAALITFQDGSVMYYPCPRLERASQVEKLTAERYRKYFEDNLYNQFNKYIHKDLVRYLARKSDTLKEEQNRPARVTLLRLQGIIPHIADLTETGQGPLRPSKPNEPHGDYFVEGTYKITPEDVI
jgi:hypothetical protein